MQTENKIVLTPRLGSASRLQGVAGRDRGVDARGAPVSSNTARYSGGNQRASPCRSPVRHTCYNGQTDLMPDRNDDIFLEGIRHHRSEWAWTCLSVGCFDEACRVSEEENDIIAWAASLALIGETSRSLLILESYIIATSVVVYERCYSWLRSRGSGGGMEAAMIVRRHNDVALSWMENHRQDAMRAIGSSIRASDTQHRDIVRRVMQLVDWCEIHRWYIIALLLHKDSATYRAPLSHWFRYWFAMLPDETELLAGAVQQQTQGRQSDKKERGGGGSGKNRKSNVRLPPLTSMRQEQTMVQLLSQCSEVEVHFVSAVAAYRTRRYRSCMTFATKVLEKSTPAANKEGGSSLTISTMMESQAGVNSAQLSGYEPNLMRFIRCLCSLHIGERTQAAADIAVLMENPYPYVASIGCCLGAFGLPLADAEEIATLLDAPPLAKQYAYGLCEYVHALTLMQLGAVEQAIEVAKAVVVHTPPHDIGYNLCDLIVYGAAALEDSTTILETSLSPHRLLYVALCPAFFGGLVSTGIRLRSDSSTFQLLYPVSFSVYSSVRQVLPLHMNRAAYLAHNRKLRDAWEEVCCAVAAADEIVGSLEFVFTECYPLRVYHYACQVGAALLDELLQEEVDAAAECLRTGNDAAAIENKNEVMVANDELGDVVVRMCQQWAQQMRDFFSHSRLSEVTQVQVAIFTREKQMLSRAIMLSRRYPKSILAQNALTHALFYDHHIPEAVDAAQKNLQEFPHAEAVIATHRLLQRKNIVYTFNYRTLLPLRYSPGKKDRIFTKRMIIVILLLTANFCILVVTVVVNIPQVISLTEGMKHIAIRLQLPSVIPLFMGGVFIVHAIVAAVVPQSLISTMLSDIHFCDTAFSRFLFSVRGIVLVNVVNALQISITGNNFLINQAIVTFLLYLVLTVLFVPFTTRAWFLPSVDEPNVGILSWLTLLSVDTATAFIILLPHIVLAALEPIMSIIFYFFPPAERPTGDAVSSSIRRRLLFHEHHRYEMSSRFAIGSGSRFIHIRLMALLYFRTHSSMETKHLAEAQMEEENYRVFPVVDADLCGDIKEEPLRSRLELAQMFHPNRYQRLRTEEDDYARDGGYSGVNAHSPNPLKVKKRGRRAGLDRDAAAAAALGGALASTSSFVTGFGHTVSPDALAAGLLTSIDASLPLVLGPSTGGAGFSTSDKSPQTTIPLTLPFALLSPKEAALAPASPSGGMVNAMKQRFQQSGEHSGDSDFKKVASFVRRPSKHQHHAYKDDSDRDDEQEQDEEEEREDDEQVVEHGIELGNWNEDDDEESDNNTSPMYANHIRESTMIPLIGHSPLISFSFGVGDFLDSSIAPVVHSSGDDRSSRSDQEELYSLPVTAPPTVRTAAQTPQEAEVVEREEEEIQEGEHHDEYALGFGSFSGML